MFFPFLCVLFRVAASLPQTESDVLDAWFENLSEQELRESWSHDDGSSLADKQKAISRFDFEVFVNIKLVGFNEPPFLQAKSDLLRFLDNSPITLFRGAHVLRTEGNQSHDLPVRTNFVFGVDVVKPSLQTSLARAIEHAANEQRTTEDKPHIINPEVVDRLIREDFTLGLPKYTIYVLNLPLLRVGGSANYVYRPAVEADGLFSLDKQEACPSNQFVSPQRYAWIDLSAGPLWYGPHSAGEGFVSTQYTMPPLTRTLSTVGSKKDVLNARVHEFFAALAALLHTTTQQLIAPPLYRFPLTLPTKTLVTVTFIHDGDEEESHASRVERMSTMWASTLRQLKELIVVDKAVEVSVQNVRMSECELCSLAYASALHTTSSRVAVHGLRTPIQKYLSSEIITQVMRNYAVDGSKIGPNVLHVPVFVFNLGATEDVLVDRFHQAVSTGNAVVAVQSMGERVETDLECNERHMSFDPRTAARPALAALLQAIGGVVATEELWNSNSKEIETNYLWSLGHTPFGYLTSDTTLSFAQKDSVPRNLLTSEISQALLSLQKEFSQFAQFKVELEAVLPPSNYLTFVRRWNLIQFKLEKARKMTALLDFPKALAYARSIAHDVNGIKAVLADAEVLGRFGGKHYLNQSASLHSSSSTSSSSPFASFVSSWGRWRVLQLGVFFALSFVCVWTLIVPHNVVASYVLSFFVKKKKL